MRRKKDRSNGITALYERLSRDDDNAGESKAMALLLCMKDCLVMMIMLERVTV